MDASLVLLLITMMTVIVVDLTDFITAIKKAVWRWVFKDKRQYSDFPLKPLDCSLCLSFWLGLLYLVIWGKWSLGLMALQLFLSFLTPVFKDALMLVKAMLQRMIDAVYDYFQL